MDALTRREVYLDAVQSWQRQANGEYKSKDGHRLIPGKSKKWLLIHKDGRRVELKQATFQGAETALAEMNAGR